MKNNRGSSMNNYIIIIIITILCFAVIGIFIKSLYGDKNLTKKEVCRNSFVLASTPVLNSNVLKCETSSVCISGGEKCKNTNPDSTIKIKVSGSGVTPVSIRNDVFRAIANEMADCWWMGLEGSGNYVSSIDALKELSKLEIGGKSAICGICSVIEFDSVIQNQMSIEKPSYALFYDFLEKNEIKPGVSYAYYFYGFNYLSHFANNPVFKPFLGIQGNYDFNPEKKINFEEAYFILLGQSRCEGASDIPIFSKLPGWHYVNFKFDDYCDAFEKQSFIVRPFILTSNEVHSYSLCANFDLF